jgi:hypothetical protein
MGEWEAKHATKKKGVAPSTLNSLISHLAVEIDKFGRAHFWDPATCSGKSYPACRTAIGHRLCTYPQLYAIVESPSLYLLHDASEDAYTCCMMPPRMPACCVGEG